MQDCRCVAGAPDGGMGVGEGISLKPVNTESLLLAPVECAAQSASGDHVRRDLWIGDIWDGPASTPECVKVGTIVGTNAATIGRDKRSDEDFTGDSDEDSLEEGTVGELAECAMLPLRKVDVAHNAVSFSPLSPPPHSMEKLVKGDF